MQDKLIEFSTTYREYIFECFFYFWNLIKESLYYLILTIFAQNVIMICTVFEFIKYCIIKICESAEPWVEWSPIEGFYWWVKMNFITFFLKILILIISFFFFFRYDDHWDFFTVKAFFFSIYCLAATRLVQEIGWYFIYFFIFYLIFNFFYLYTDIWIVTNELFKEFGEEKFEYKKWKKRTEDSYSYEFAKYKRAQFRFRKFLSYTDRKYWEVIEPNIEEYDLWCKGEYADHITAEDGRFLPSKKILYKKVKPYKDYIHQDVYYIFKSINRNLDDERRWKANAHWSGDRNAYIDYRMMAEKEIKEKPDSSAFVNLDEAVEKKT